jgi:hypothetical protein
MSLEELVGLLAFGKRLMEYFERIADEWSERANELAQWVMRWMVNRTDVWGRYVRKKSEESTIVITAPFRDERGKVFLDEDSLRKHFRHRKPGGQLGLHSASGDLTSRWLAIDIDLHDTDDLGVTPESNLAAAQFWRKRIEELGGDPLLLDSNGAGGLHLLVIFAEPMSTDSVNQFGTKLVADFSARGLDQRPEIFPDKPTWDRYGDWLRLPGRHHSRPHFTRVWNDDPTVEEKWLVGHDAIDRIVATRPVAVEVLERWGISRVSRTVCLDFDGVLHSYRSGWRGLEVISDPPIHGTKDAIDRLRRQYRVVVYSARCRTPEGIAAIQSWLLRHGIEVDEVSPHKPPALVYVDDRAIRFEGDWEETLIKIQNFRR